MVYDMLRPFKNIFLNFQRLQFKVNSLSLNPHDGLYVVESCRGKVLVPLAIMNNTRDWNDVHIFSKTSNVHMAFITEYFGSMTSNGFEVEYNFTSVDGEK